MPFIDFLLHTKGAKNWKLKSMNGHWRFTLLKIDNFKSKITFATNLNFIL